MSPADAFREAVRQEIDRARSLHPKPYNSAHEAFAVLLEEVDELWDEVRKKQSDPCRIANMANELIQIAAVCQRFSEDVIDPEIEDVP